MMWEGFSPASWTMYSGFHRVVELDLLAHHRFALDDQLGRMALGDAEHDRVGFGGGFGPVHLHAVAGEIGFELFEQVGQPGKTVLADAFGEIAQGIQFVRVGKLGGALGHQEVHRAAEAAAQVGVVHRRVHALAQSLGGDEGDRLAGVLAGGVGLRAHCGAPSALMSRTTSSFGPWAP